MQVDYTLQLSTEKIIPEAKQATKTCQLLA